MPVGDAGVASLLASLSPRERIAQLVMPWMPSGYVADDDPTFVRVRTWVDSLGVGGVIAGVGTPLDVAARLNRLQARAKVPLLVASDLEAGAAFRFAGATGFPTNMGVAATGDSADAYAVGRITATEGRAMGLHVAFAPVADVNSNPDNPIINTRSFGSDPARVGALVAATVHGLQEHGMLAVVKHFPGHGDTDVDSHLALPSTDATWSRLDAVELVPFRAAVRAGAAGVMSAHIALPRFIRAAGRPGTLAPDILTGVLRDSLGFGGLAVTDALDMAGVVGAYGSEEGAVLALEAGADLLLQPVDPVETVAAIERAVAAGRISMARIDRSAARILALKQRLGLFRERMVPLEHVADVVGRAEHAAVARSIAQRAIVLGADDRAALDSVRARRRTLGVVVYVDDANAAAGATFVKRLRQRGDTVRLQRLTPASGPASLDSARAVLLAQPYAVLAVALRPTSGRGQLVLPPPLAALADSMSATRPLLLLSLGSPYVVRQLPRVGTLLFAWAATPVSEEAAADALVDAAIGGTLPVPLPPRFPLGAGLHRAALAAADAGPAGR